MRPTKTWIPLALVVMGCTAGGTSPKAVSPAESSAPPATPPPNAIDWVGKWTASSGATQEDAEVVMDAGGRFRADHHYGPEQHCCIQGTYQPKGETIAFKVERGSCKTAVFTDYTRVFKHSPEKVVLALPGHEEHITKGENGELEGPVWTFTRTNAKGELSQLNECH